MKNRSDTTDPELQKNVEGLSKTQVALMADIFLGLADYLRKPEKDGLFAYNIPHNQN